MPNSKLKIIFINYGPYLGCCGVHIHFLANSLVELGHECYVFLSNTDDASTYFGNCHYTIHSFSDILTLPVEYFDDAILHVWTSREAARLPTQILRERVNIPYFVHLEDNEILISGKSIGHDTLEEQKKYVQNNPEQFKNLMDTNPLNFEPFLQNSMGVTCIINKLEDLVPESVPRMTFWPACEDEFFYMPTERNMVLRRAFEIDDDAHILVYPGAIHNFNANYFIELLIAIEQLSQENIPIKLIRCGMETFEYSKDAVELYKKHALYVEDVFASELPRLMALADILVQPGSPGAFDDYRFPSKVPFFLASGRPVILPKTNVAEKLTHGLNCFLMQKGDAEEIAKYLRMLTTHHELAKNMGAQGRATARRLFNWTTAAKSIVPFYEQGIGRFEENCS